MDYVEQGFTPPDLPEPLVLGATHYNTGVFGGGHHEEMTGDHEPVLNPAETLVQSALTAYLARHEKVVFLDLGAMCGLSATILATRFPEEISQGKLIMVATQREKNYSIENILWEAKKRLSLQPTRERLLRVNTSTLTYDYRRALNKALERTKLFLTAGELSFMESHHHLVHFITDVDTERLPQALDEKLGVEHIHFLHEHSAGLTFADNKRRAAIAVADAMAPDGMIFSIVKWHHYQDNNAFLQWENRGVSAKDLTLAGLPSAPPYTLFAYPDAPKVI